MWQAWKHHVIAAAVLALVGVGSIISIKNAMPGVLGNRAFGYGALVLLSSTLVIGPLARLWPRRLSAMLPYRRAMGIWSALAAATHLCFALQLVQHSFEQRTPITLFVREWLFFDTPTQTLQTRHQLFIQDNLTALAWVGLIALLLLLMIAAVSNDRAQRLLGQPAWKLIQQQAYTAMLFAALHVLLMQFGGKLKGSLDLLWWAPWLLLAVLCLQIIGFVVTIRRRGGIRSGSGK
jgi:DMSO/TMAO reductase YedYZ heme-binding membrane subunit